MKFKADLDRILAKDKLNWDEANALANLLIPQIMYVPFKEAGLIIEKIQSFEAYAQLDRKGLLLLQMVRSFLTYRQGNYEQAIAILKNAACLENNTIDGFCKACYSSIMGACYRSLGNKEMSLSSFHYAIQQFYAQPTQAYEIYLNTIPYYHIAEINAEMGNYEAMLRWHKQFYELGKKQESPDMLNRGLNGVGRAYLELGDVENCLRYLQLAEKTSSETGGNIPFMAKNLHDLGIAYFKKQSYEDALNYLSKALEIRKEQQLSDAATSTHIMIGKVYLAQSNFEKAMICLHKARAIAEDLKLYKKLGIIYDVLSTAYEENSQYDLALEYYKKYHAINDSLNDVISTQRENERIREINTELHQQKNIISDQKRKIQAYADQLEDANKHLQNFATIAAHDLKAPIRVINGFVGLLLKKHKDRLDDSDKEYFEFITQNMSNLSRMIDDLLALSKLDQNLPPKERINTKKLLEEVVDRFKGKIQELNADILIQNDLPNLFGHDSLIGQVFQNLIDNALKYRSEAIPKIQISHTLPENPEYIQFEIRDNGQGIPEEEQAKIFELFSGTIRENSHGIGLATCKKIIGNYGGEIWVQSKVGVGTSMFFTLLSEECV